jgi:hypothetical protein
VASVGVFDRFRRQGSDKEQASSSGRPSGQNTAELKEFLQSRNGSEAFLEPPTSVYAMTLCVVAADGEYVRRPVKDEKQARKLCDDHGVPVYDARKVGYPRRMRDYDRGVRHQGVDLDDLPPLETTEDADADDQ